MSDLVEQILHRTRKDTMVRFGIVESVAGGLASVRMGGAVIEGCNWRRSYMPIVGDRVAVLGGGSGWLILDAVAQQVRAWNEPVTISVRPSIVGRRLKPMLSDSWDDDLTTPEIDPKLPEPLSQQWEGISSFGGQSSLLDENAWSIGMGDYLAGNPQNYLNYVRSKVNAAMYLYYWNWLEGYEDSFGSDPIPEDGEVLSMSLVLRSSFRDNAPLTIYPHALPLPWEGPTPPSTSPAEHIYSSIAPLEVPDIPAMEVTMVPLPDEWVNGLQDGTITGALLYLEGQGQVILNNDYKIVSGERVILTNDLLTLQVQYMTPVEGEE